MVKVKFNSAKFTKELTRKFQGFTRDKKEMEKVSRTILRNIKADSRDGIGFDGKSFPKIKSKTIERRAKLSSINNMSRFFKSHFSNATFMGDTINKITSKLVGKGKIEFFGKGKHRKIKGVRGKSLKGSDAPVGEILKGLKSLGYNILGVSQKSRESIKKQFLRYLRRRT